MYHSHADDEIVAMGYANFNKTKEEEEKKGMVTINERAFKSYVFDNYVKHVEKDILLDILYQNLEVEKLLELAQDVWELPFRLTEEGIELIDANELLLRHTTSIDMPSSLEEEEDEDCFGCDEDWDSEYTPYDDLDAVVDYEDDELIDSEEGWKTK